MRRGPSLLLLATLLGCADMPAPKQPPPPEAQAPAARPAKRDLPATGGTLADLMRAALARSPRIQAARARWAAAVDQITLARSLPDPQLMYGYFLERVETRVGPQRQRFGIRQRLPFPWKLKLAADSAARGAQIEALGYRITVRDVLVELKDRYFEYWYLHRARRIAQGHAKLLEQLQATARVEQARGSVTLTDMLRLDSQVSQLEYDLLTMTELSRVAAARINALLDRAPDAPIGAPGRLVPPVDLTLGPAELGRLGRQHRQEVLRARAMLEKAGIELSRARWGWAPNFSVGLSYIDTGSAIMPVDDSGKDPVILDFGLELPIWPGKNMARIRRAEHRQAAARHTLVAQERQLDATLSRLAFKVRNSRRLVELYGKTLLPQTEQAAAQAREWYRTGQGGFGHLIEIQSVLYNYHLATDRALADHHQSLNRLEGLIGVSLRGGKP